MIRAIVPSTIIAKEASRRLATAQLSPSCKTTSNHLRSRPKSTFAASTRNTIVTRHNNQTVTKRQQHKKSTLAISSKNNTITTEQLSSQQIRSIFLSAAIPMVGFGFMDNFVMITAGQAIDNSLGVQMGLATMTAAAMGQVVSDVSGVMFGDTLARIFKVSSAHLSASQRKLAAVHRLRLAGAILGVIAGCTLGATALYIVPDRNNQRDNGNSAAIIENGSNSVHHQQQKEVQIKEKLLLQLQLVLNDVMTNQEEKWYSRDARCTLFVNEPLSSRIPSNSNNSLKPYFGKNKVIGEDSPAIIDRLDGGGGDNEKDSAAIIQSAKESRVVVFTNTIYVPVLADNDNNNINNSNILGVLKVELQNGSFYSGSEIKDAKRVARNLGFFMNHMM